MHFRCCFGVICLLCAQELSEMDTNSLCVGAQLAQHAAEPSSRHPLLNRMQNIEIRGKKSTIRLKFGGKDEEETGKVEEKQGSQPKRKKYHSDHGKVHLPPFAQFQPTGSVFSNAHCVLLV